MLPCFPSRPTPVRSSPPESKPFPHAPGKSPVRVRLSHPAISTLADPHCYCPSCLATRLHAFLFGVGHYNVRLALTHNELPDEDRPDSFRSRYVMKVRKKRCSFIVFFMKDGSLRCFVHNRRHYFETTWNYILWLSKFHETPDILLDELCKEANDHQRWFINRCTKEAKEARFRQAIAPVLMEAYDRAERASLRPRPRN